jgi:hypothetical protein
MLLMLYVSRGSSQERLVQILVRRTKNNPWCVLITHVPANFLAMACYLTHTVWSDATAQPVR